MAREIGLRFEVRGFRVAVRGLDALRSGNGRRQGENRYMGTRSSRLLPHQSLRVWHRAVALVQLCSKQAPRDSELRNQTSRAAKSVALNIAEGAPLSGRSRERFFRIARASAVEVAAGYELASAIGERVPVGQVTHLVDEIYAMLTKLLTR